jgi:hypothetical protein
MALKSFITLAAEKTCQCLTLQLISTLTTADKKFNRLKPTQLALSA